ncbi:hypothetical protein BH11PSE11_BH11PSE11_30890 [soil metagenome]
MKKSILGMFAYAVCNLAFAFMPVSGMWQINAEATGLPGRGFGLDVQNEVVVFTYYGYRADGSALFHVAAGPIVNNVFIADLLSVTGGTPIGGAYKAGTVGTSPGKVTLTFTSGTHGTISLPGESIKAISKDSHGYVNGPDGLLGTWLFSESIGGTSTTAYAYQYVLNTKLAATSTGNGIVATSNGSFGCEYDISGSFAGEIVCVRTSTDGYFMKFFGDSAAGVNAYSNAYFDARAVRIATKTGTRTGVNDGGTIANVQIYDAPDQSSKKLAASMRDGVLAPMSAGEVRRAAAYAAWSAEALKIMSTAR